MKGNYFYIYNLQKVGFISFALGMFISGLFGFIFGLILETTEMPWSLGDFTTEEIKGNRPWTWRCSFYFSPPPQGL